MKKLIIISLAAMALASGQGIKVGDLPSMGTMTPATDLLIIGKTANGGTFKVTPDNLVTGWGMTTAGANWAKAADITAQRSLLWTFGSDATGDLWYRTASGFARLPIGTSGQVLTASGSPLIPTWATGGGGGGSGDVVGPGSATDNAIVRFDATTGKLIQNSTVTITDNGTINAVATASGYASLNLPHGTAPSSPTNGDVWTTTAGIYVRVNGSTVGPLGTGGGGGGLTYFTESENSSTPNGTVYSNRLIVTSAATNADFVVSPKGTGALVAHTPDNSTTGGNKRGTQATDWQRERGNAADVASGARATIGGGGYNRASNDYAVVSGGFTNLASGLGSGILGGVTNTASSNYSVIMGGQGNTANGQYAVAVGQNSTATTQGFAQGENVTASSYGFSSGFRATGRSLTGAFVRASGRFSADGDAQTTQVMLRRQSTSTTAVDLTADNASLGSTNIVVLPNSSAFYFKGNLIARSSGGDVKTWSITGTIERGANAASTAFVGTPAVTALDADAGASTWTAAVLANTTQGGLQVQGTGAAATTINWVASIETIEVQ